MKKNKPKKDHELKDDILRVVSKLDVVGSLDVAEELNITNETVIQYTNDIIKDSYIVAVTPADEDRENYNGRVTPKGHTFLEGGGYTTLYNKQRWANFRKNGAQILTVLIALGGLWLTYWQAKTSDKTGKLEDQIENQQARNEQLQKQVDSLIKATPVQPTVLDTSISK